jgi:alpha-N-arabinofuranosidase
VTASSKTGLLYLKLVNASSSPQAIDIKIDGASRIRPTMTISTLHGATTKATNSITDPTRIVPVVSHPSTAAASFHHIVPAFSIQVLDIDRAH